MNILFLTQFFYPDIQATSQLFLELCEDLAKDYKVEVICTPPLLIADTENKNKNPTEEYYKEIYIKRVFSTRKEKILLFNRAINHLSFLYSSFFYFLFHRKTDIFIYTSDNPFNFLNALLFLSKPRVYICQDLYLEQGLTIGFFKNGVMIFLLGLIQRLAFCLADKVVVIGPRMKSYLERIGIPAEKIEIIANWADIDNITPYDAENQFSKKYNLTGKFVVMHSGRIGLTQDMDLFLRCAKDMKIYHDIIFVVIGEGVKKKRLISRAERLGLDNIMFLPYQPKENLKYQLASASLFLILEKSGLASYLIPSKLYAIMASARPIIATVEKDSGVYDIIMKAHCGITVEPGNLKGLKDGIYKIYENRALIRAMGNGGRDYTVKHFARTAMTDQYKQILKELGTCHYG